MEGNNSSIQIEFFHDVLCAWCYALSPRIRKLVQEFPDIKVIHRSFALAPSQKRLEEMFGSKQDAKEEILNHWRAANENDDAHRIKAEVMLTKSFDYPYSLPPLMACKEAELQGGQESHWNYFDRIQRAHLTECLNVNDMDVLIQCAADIGLDVQKFKDDLISTEGKKKLEDALDADNYLARQYGVNSVPTLVINGKWILSGAHKYDFIKNIVEQILENGEPKNVY